MRTLFATAVLSISLLAGGLSAQVHGPGYGRPYREPLFDRVQGDLSRAMEHAYARERVSRAQRELGKFQAERASGRFGGHQFHKAVNALDSVVRSNGIDPRDRDVLARDLQNLRGFGAANRY
jgi:hypothetical protein